MVTEVGEKDFDAVVINAKRPVFVDFWAPWCGPCRSIAPVVEDLAEEMNDTLDFCKMNVDENSSVPGRFGIRSIPTMIVFKNGQVAGQITGNVGKNGVREMIEKALNENV